MSGRVQRYPSGYEPIPEDDPISGRLFEMMPSWRFEPYQPCPQADCDGTLELLYNDMGGAPIVQCSDFDADAYDLQPSHRHDSADSPDGCTLRHEHHIPADVSRDAIENGW